jgi:endonuclease/exonuclease/phosphatase family metal-dependent hydrolase
MTFKFEGGLDLHAISVHLKSGVNERDLRLRKQSWAALPGIAASETRRSNDPDLLILGDFNSMGCQKCETAVDSESEIAELDQQLGLGELHLQRMTTDLGCSHYFQRKPAQIDHILVTTDTRALAPSAQVTVEGYCKELHCRHYAGKDPNAYRHLSDHCPLVVELVDRDLD